MNALVVVLVVLAATGWCMAFLNGWIVSKLSQDQSFDDIVDLVRGRHGR